jgi:hypothetical protein
MSTLVQFTKSELRAAGLFDADADYEGAVAACVTALMETFVAYGQSGGSAEQVLALFTKLAKHRPITPLTGEDDEWDDRSEMSGYPLWQNKRDSRVFKGGRDGAFDTWMVLEPGSRVGDGKVRPIFSFPYAVE